MANWTEEQIQAIETEGTNIIVSAGAGSGKTAVLTERVLRKLKKGIDIDSLLILTFTKAAASEMKERIQNSIKEEPSLKEQLDKIDSTYITTFDSFALSVVKKYSYLLNLPDNLTIAEESIMTLAKKQIMNEVFEEMYQEEDLSFETFISDFCLKDDTEIQKYMLQLNEKLSLRYDKREYLNRYIEMYFADEKLDADIISYESFLKEKIQVIQNLVISLSTLTQDDYIQKINDVLEPLFLSQTYEEIKKNIFVDFPRLPNGSTDELKKKKEKIVKEMDHLKNFTLYKDKTDIKNGIISTIPYLKSICTIMKRFDNKLDKYKRTNDMYEFTDIAKFAIEIVENHQSIREEMQKKFNEILLDEYQDTSDLQEKFISCIASNNVYMVGDIKQSIYRFRNANPYIFKEKYDTYSEKKQGVKIDLMKNFRSRREVLNNINEIFDHIMDNTIGGAAYQNGHRMIFGNTVYEEHGATEDNHDLTFYTYTYDKGSKYTKEEIEVFLIAEDIKKKIEQNYHIYDKEIKAIRPVTYNDFVILLDRSKNFLLYKKIFEYESIPLMIYQDESLRNGYDLDIIKNILKLIIKVKNHLYDTEFKYAFMSIARSYLVRCDDASIFHCLRIGAYNTMRFMQTVHDIVKEIDVLDNQTLLIEILEKFNFYEKIIEVGNVEESLIRFEYLVDLASNLSLIGYDINDMLSYFESITTHDLDIKYSLNTNSTSSVKIMTIHKSKGLEYPICYFSGLYETFNTLEVKERFCYDKQFGIMVPIFQNGFKETIYKTMYKEKYLLEEISEKIRLLYVALTRAKEKMIFVGDLKDILCDIDHNSVIDKYTRMHYTSFLDILDSIKPFIEMYVEPVAIDTISLTKNYSFIKEMNFNKIINPCSTTVSVSEYACSTTLIESTRYSKEDKQIITKEIKRNLEFGTYLHFLFELVDFMNPNVDKLPIPDVYKEKINAFLAQDIFRKKIKAVYKEYEFIEESEHEENHGVIDLILQYEDGYAIIDYKTKDIVDSMYKNQLEGYRKYLQNITKSKVDIYIYSIFKEQLKKL